MKTTASPSESAWTAIRSGAARWQVCEGDEELARVLEGLRFARRGSIPEIELLKDADPVFWARVRVGSREWFLKGRRTRGLRETIGSLLRPPGFREEWRNTWWLRSRGIETAAPAALGEARRFGFVVETFIAYRWERDARNLLAFLEAKHTELPPRGFDRLRRRTAFELGRLFGSLHAADCYHRQFHDRNILVTEGAGGELRLLPIDLDHLTICGKLTEEDRDWNFYQLAWHLRRLIHRWKPGLRDVARFLKGYHLSEPGCAPSWRQLLERLRGFFPAEPLAGRPRREEWRRKAPSRDPGPT